MSLCSYNQWLLIHIELLYVTRNWTKGLVRVLPLWNPNIGSGFGLKPPPSDSSNFRALVHATYTKKTAYHLQNLRANIHIKIWNPHTHFTFLLPVFELGFVLQFLHKFPCSKHQLAPELASSKTPQRVSVFPHPCCHSNPRLQPKKNGFLDLKFLVLALTLKPKFHQLKSLGLEFFFLFLLELT